MEHQNKNKTKFAEIEEKIKAQFEEDNTFVKSIKLLEGVISIIREFEID